MKDDRPGEPTLPEFSEAATFVYRPEGSSPAPEAVHPAEPERYRVKGEIARGGMGVVFRVEDHDIRRHVAMKVILGSEHEQGVVRFIEEAQVTGQLEHPNIVPVHELGRDDAGRVYFTMKLVEGQSLSQIIARLSEGDAEARVRFSRSTLLQIFLKVCDAVAFAHSKGVIHRDLKPDNVMVGRFGEVLVMDWGLSKVTGQEEQTADERVATIRSDQPTGGTLSGAVMGTPAYMSPEQAAGRSEEVDEASDVFALGAMLHCMLAYEPPYQGSSLSEVLGQARAAEERRHRPSNPTEPVPRELVAICVKAMARERSARYASVEQLGRDMLAYVDHRLVAAHDYRLAERLLRMVQRHPAASLAAAVALIFTILGGAITWTMRAESRAQAARAEAEALRAERAEEQRAEAEGRAARDREALEKGRRVATVLRQAASNLRKVLGTLNRSFHSPDTPAETQRVGREQWPTVARFCASVPEDPASQAAMLAVKGWLLHLSGQGEQAQDMFRQAQRRDPDVAYGYLFEAMVPLQEYLRRQQLPSAKLSDTRLYFDEMPAETARMRRARQRFGRLLEQAGRSRVWGEQSSAEFAAVLDGFRAVQQERFGQAEAGLDKALGIPEMIWMEPSILHARARMRYLARDFDGALADVERVLAGQPRMTEAIHDICKILLAKGLLISSRGGDPQPVFRRLVRFGDSLVRSHGSRSWVYQTRALAFLRIALSEGNRNRDPLPWLKQAESAADSRVRLAPRDARAHGSRATIYTWMGIFSARRRQDPVPWFRKAIADCNRAQQLRPKLEMGYINRARARLELGKCLARRGEDPRTVLRRALVDYDLLLKRRENSELLENRALILLELAEAQQTRGVDPRPLLRRSIADLDRILTTRPRQLSCYSHRARARLALAEASTARSEDPGRLFEQAIADYDHYLQRKPKYSWLLLLRGRARLSWARHRLSRRADPRPQLAQAIGDVSKEIARNDEPWIGFSGRASAYLLMADYERRQGKDATGSYRRALADRIEAVRGKPSPIDLRGLETTAGAFSQYLLRQGKDSRPMLRQAVAILDGVLATNPRLAVAYVRRAKLQMATAQALAKRKADPRPAIARAVADYRQALSRDPGRLDTYQLLARAQSIGMRSQKQYGGDWKRWGQVALTSWQAAIAREPRAWEHHANKGLVHRTLRDWEGAARSFHQAWLLIGKSPARRKDRQQLRSRVMEANGQAWARPLVLARGAFKRARYDGLRERLTRILASARRCGAEADPLFKSMIVRARYDLTLLLASASAGKAGPRATAKPISRAQAAAFREQTVASLRELLGLGGRRLLDEKAPVLAPILALPEVKAMLAKER